MRDRLTPSQLARIQFEYENSEHRPETAFASILARRKPDLLQQSPTELLFQPGEIILREGEAGDAAYIIRAGAVAAIKGNLKTMMVLSFCGPGEVIGEISMLDTLPRSATLVAIRLTRLVRIRPDLFHELITKDAEISAALLLTLASRLRETDNARATAHAQDNEPSSELVNLRAEKERLIELQHLREEMSNLVVHDLRVPLGNITNALGLLHMLLPADIWEENREVFEIARASSERLTRLSESLLEMSRLESGEITIHWSVFSIEDLIIYACNQIDLHLRSGMCIKRHIAMRIPEIRGDQDLILRVILNLLDNAIKYSPPDGAIIVSAEAQRSHVLVSVQDSGPGIPFEKRDNLFERFSRIEHAATSRGGFGLGLVYCRLAVEAHGGKIWVEDGENGGGSKFVFSLPILGK